MKFGVSTNLHVQPATDFPIASCGPWSLRNIDSGRQAVPMSGNRGAIPTISSGAGRAVPGLRVVSDEQTAASVRPSNTRQVDIDAAAVVSYVMRRAARETAQRRVERLVMVAVQVMQQRRTAA